VKGIPQGRYPREFRQEAVRLIVEDGLSCREAAERHHFELQMRNKAAMGQSLMFFSLSSR
jgi:transposase-like protein